VAVISTFNGVVTGVKVGAGGGDVAEKMARQSMRGLTVGSSPWCGRWVAAGHGATASEGGNGVARSARAKKKGKEEGGAGPMGWLACWDS
jgi:hypothetical protein